MPNLDSSSQHPTSPAPDKLLERAKSADEELSAERMKYPLPENTEPCFTYIPEPREVRKR